MPLLSLPPTYRRGMRPGRRRGRRRLRVAAVVLVAVGVAGAGWLSVRVQQAVSDLNRAKDAVADLPTDLAALPSAADRLDAVGGLTGSARAASADPLWRAAELLPVLGDDLRAVRVVAESTDALVSQVVQPLVRAGLTLDVGSLRRDDGSLDLAALEAATPTLARSDAAARRIAGRLAAVPTDGLVPPVAEGLEELTSATQELARTTQRLARGAQVLPPVLGFEGPRRYFVAFQNVAEARASGGIVGTFGILDVEAGRLELVRTGVNNELDRLPAAPVDLGAEYRARYGELAAEVDNANLTPHFPFAAEQLLGHWRAASGESLDGVVAVDPVGLARLLEATGPVTLSDGEVVAAEDVVDLTLRQVYERFTDEEARRGYLVDLVHRTFAQLTSPSTSTEDLLRAVADAVGDRRLLLYSAVAEEEALLEDLGAAGSMPSAGSGARLVVVNNAGANKLDYYLDRDIRYEVGCAQNGRTRSVLRVALTNGAPAEGLPRYVMSHAEDLAASPATNRTIVSAYVPAGTGSVGLTVDGRPAGFLVGRERGFDVFSATVDLPPGERVELVWELDEPVQPAEPVLVEQPLVRPADQAVRLRCRTG